MSSTQPALDPERTTLVIGPPGTGKTTHLLNVVENALEHGTPPARIGYVSFTTKAANEARGRAAARFGLDASELPWFRTIHSLAFRQLGMSPQQLVKTQNLQELGQLLNVDIAGHVSWEEGISTGTSKGDRALQVSSLARVRCRPLTDQWHEDPDSLPWHFVERVAVGLSAYKEARGLMDFTDLLYNFVERGEVPPLDVLCVDEAQDLSAIQWEVVRRLASRAKEIYVAGDDDQAIYRWAGADVDTFIGLKGKEQVLGQSYRVPSAIQEVAHRIIERVSNRRPKAWAPRPEPGRVSYCLHPDDLDLGAGTWLVLARNKYLLDEVAAMCRRHGYLFTVHGSSSVTSGQMAAISSWEALRTGKRISVEDVKAFLPFISAKHWRRGAKTALAALDPTEPMSVSRLQGDYGLSCLDPWHESLDLLSILVREYVLAALRRGEQLRREPRIRLSTIHAAKGGESDNVAVLTDMGGKTYKQFRARSEDEARVWYVAATRAREHLCIVRPQTAKHFAL